MAIQTIPGVTGFAYAKVASMDKRAVGKLTDTNHLESFHSTEPADYNRKINGCESPGVIPLYRTC